jgi:hypothetical protein
MSITGVSGSTLNGARAASSDGVDDFGLADGPQTLPQQRQFGIAMVFRSSDTRDNTFYLGSDDQNNGRFLISDFDTADNSNGEISFFLAESENRLFVETKSVVNDSNIHLIVMNKLKDGGVDPVEIYVDDMKTPTGVTKHTDTGFRSGSYNSTKDMAFFSRNQGTSPQQFKTLDMSFVEFNEQPYSQQDRLDLAQRVPGL